MVRVTGHTRRDGTRVRPHTRSAPNRTAGSPTLTAARPRIRVAGHFRRDGTRVRPHTRSAPAGGTPARTAGPLVGVGLVAAVLLLVALNSSGGRAPSAAPDFTPTLLARSEGGSCAGLSYGQAHDHFLTHPCTALVRAAYDAVDRSGATLRLAVARVTMPDATAAADLRALIDRPGTGNITEMVTGVRFTGTHYASRVDGTTVTLAQAEPAPGSTPTGGVLDQAARHAATLNP
ncbi:hypothetical protein [Actinosynnema sp. NPDC020468]|uniref:hypothetical protein n=1 Tax=Actinosynnema sp. NPDC020468 TaxID=3154488 RepID=UPI0033DE500A